MERVHLESARSLPAPAKMGNVSRVKYQNWRRTMIAIGDRYAVTDLSQNSCPTMENNRETGNRENVEGGGHRLQFSRTLQDRGLSNLLQVEKPQAAKRCVAPPQVRAAVFGTSACRTEARKPMPLPLTLARRSGPSGASKTGRFGRCVVASHRRCGHPDACRVSTSAHHPIV